MAVRPVYSAEIKFNFDTKGLEKSVKRVEGIVRSSIQNIGKMTSDIQIDIPDLEKIGPKGGLSNIGDRLARQIRGRVGEAFKGLADDIDPSDIDRALREVADTLGSTSDSIIKRLAHLKDDTGKVFRELKETGIYESQALYDALIGRSIFTDLFRDIIAGFRELSSQVSGTMSNMSGNITKSTKEMNAKVVPAIEKFTDAFGSKAADQIRKTTDAVAAFGSGFSEAMSNIDSPVEALEEPKFRQTVASIEETLTRLPDKSAASFKLLQRSFGEVRAEAIKVQKQFEKGIVKEEDLISAKERLDAIGESISEFKTNELERLRGELQRTSDTVSLTSRTFGDRMRDIKDGISIASETGENKLLSLRVAMFGVGEATGPVSKLLDRFTRNLDDVGKAEGRLAEITARTTKSLASQNSAIKSSIDAIKQVAKIEGLHAGALNEVDAQVGRVEKAYKDMTTTIEATGKATPQQVARVREEYRLLEESITLVKVANKDAIGPETLAALGDLEQKISRNVPATRILAATLNTASEKVDKLKRSSKDLSGDLQKNISLFGRIKQSLRDFFSFTSKASNEMESLGESTSKAASIAATAGGVFIGAFGATLLSSIGGIKGALVALTDSVSSQVQRSTDRIQRAFSLLPSEAEAVSGAISDVYEQNLGGSIDEIGEATQRAIARFRDLGVTSQEEISGVVADAFRLSDTYKFDVPESLDAAAVLMKSFNLTTKESTEFLTGLGQAGIIGSDAIDSILEYSTQIQSAGGNADNLFNIIRTGFAGGGTLGTDKAVDLFKEFRILISEGSDDVKDALNEIGVNSTQLMAQLADGTVSVTDAFDFVNEKLGQLDSQTEITRLGATIMGTQFEDMGNQMALAIRTTGTSMDDLSGITVGLATKYTDLGSGMEAINRRLEVSLGPLKDTFLAIANQAIPLVMSGIDALAPVVERVAARVQMLIDALSSGDWGAARDIVMSAVASIAEGVSSVLEWLIVSGFDWGANFVIEIANGLIETANSVIVEAMNYIGDMIGSFLAPGSPPERGPLSNIDKWGGKLADTFGKSFSSADFKFVEDATKPIEEHFEKTFGKGGFTAFEGIKSKFTDIVTEINKTGLIDETKFEEIEKAIGGANAALTRTLKIQLKLKSAETALAKIQQSMSEAQQAGFVSDKLKKKLKTAEVEVKWQKESLRLQDKTADAAKGMARIGSAASAGAKAATRAIKGAVDRQLQFIRSGYEREKALLEQKFNAGLIKEDEYLKKLIKLEEKYVDTSLQRGLLSGEELSKWSERLAGLKSSLEEIKSTSKGVVPIGDALFGKAGLEFEVPDIPKNLGDNLLTSAKELGSSFSDSLADGLLETARVRLSSAFSDIGTKISELFKTKILDKITPAQKETGGIIGSALLGIGVSATITKIGFIASKIGMLSGFALRLTYIGTAIWLIWKNWDKILVGVSATIEYLTGVWTDFSDRLGGSAETLAMFRDIFSNIKDVLSDVGANLVDFVLDALEGQSVSFADFIGIFDFSAIDTGPIGKVIQAIGDAFREQARQIKLSLFGPEGLVQIGDGEGEATRAQKILANFVSIFETVKTKVQAIQEAFSEFMAEDRLGGRIASLIGTITESWGTLSVVLGAAIIPNLGKIMPLIARFVPILGPIAATLGKLIPIVGVVTVVISNFEKIWPPVEAALGGIVLAVEGVISVINGLFMLFDDETRAEGFEMILSGIVATIGGIQEAVLSLGTAIGVFFASAISDISGGVATMLEAVGLEKIAEPFRNVEQLMDGIAIKMGENLDKVRVILTGLRDQITTILGMVSKIFTDWAKGIWESVTGWFTKLWDDLVGNSIITDMMADIVKVLGMEEAIKKVQLVVSDIKSAFLDTKTYVSTQMSLLGEVVNSKFSSMSTFVSGKITALKGFVADIKTFISDTITAISEFELPTLTDIAASLTDLTGVDISTAMADFTTGVATPIANLGITINDSVSTIKTTISGIFADIDPTLEATKFAVGAATPISLLETTIGDSAARMVESLLGMFDIDLSVSILDMSTTVVTGIETMATDGIEAVSGFATDFVDYILGIPGRIREKISDFADIGSLLSSAFGFGEKDITGDVAGELKAGASDIIAPVESTTEKIKGAWSDAYDWVVGGSVVPDMVAGVIGQFNIMSTTTLPTVTGLTLAIQKAFSDMSLAVIQSMSNMSLVIYTNTFGTNSLIVEGYLLMAQQVNMHMTNMQTNTSVVLNSIRPMWLSSFAVIMDTTRTFGVVGKQVLTAIDNAVKKLIGSVKKLKTGIGDVKSILDELVGTDLGELNDAFKRMYSLVKKTRDAAKKFAKFMEAARDAAEDIGDTLGGNVPGGAPGAEHGAWDVPRDQLMFIHRNETVLPAEVAADFRALMMTLQDAGIGGRSFGFQTGTPQVATRQPTAGGPTIVNIRAEFPNVTSAQEADSIADRLNELIDNSRKFAAVGGN